MSLSKIALGSISVSAGSSTAGVLQEVGLRGLKVSVSFLCPAVHSEMLKEQLVGIVCSSPSPSEWHLDVLVVVLWLIHFPYLPEQNVIAETTWMKHCVLPVSVPVMSPTLFPLSLVTTNVNKGNDFITHIFHCQHGLHFHFLI